VESLALIAALIVAVAAMGGPLALLLSFLPMRWTRAVAIGLGAIASLDGARLIWLRVSVGATIMGVVGLLTGGIALWRCLRRRPPALFDGLPLPTHHTPTVLDDSPAHATPGHGTGSAPENGARG